MRMTTEQPKGRGGKREGAGRKAIYGKAAPMFNIRLPDELREWCMAQAGGASDYIRRLIIADKTRAEKETGK